MNTSQSPNADILIVDDTLENLHLLSEILTQQGYEVRMVKSGAMVLRGVQAQPADLILLDMSKAGGRRNPTLLHNYRKYSDWLSLDLVNNPDLVIHP
jgi:CheY-like chemotaxis protein